MKAPHPDSHYLQALLDNDHQGIVGLYDNFATRIERFVCANSGSVDDARDIMQEALLAITRQARRPEFQLTCPFEAYLYLVSRGKWLNELKRRKRAVVTSLEAGGFETTEDAEALAEKTMREEARDRLFRHFFEKLAANCRQLIQLSWSGLSMEAVSQQLGMTYGYARKRKSECVAQLMGWIKAAPEYALLKMDEG
jgi:RNA polymerase sigma factor (sigma-70 family)